jgi:hypothetical protein
MQLGWQGSQGSRARIFGLLERVATARSHAPPKSLPFEIAPVGHLVDFLVGTLVGTRDARAYLNRRKRLRCRYWQRLGCSQSGRDARSCLDAAQQYDDVFSQPSHCPSAVSPAATDVIPLFEFGQGDGGPGGGGQGEVAACSEACRQGLKGWVETWGCCASVAAQAQEDWWRAFGGLSEAPSTFSIMLQSEGYQYLRHYRLPQKCDASAQLVTSRCALALVCGLSMVDASGVAVPAPGPPCCPGAVCANGGKRREDQRCRCLCADGYIGPECASRSSYVVSTVRLLAAFHGGYPLVTFDEEESRRKQLAALFGTALGRVHVQRVFVCSRSPRAGRGHVAMEVRFGVTGSVVEEFAQAQRLLAQQASANASGAMLRAGFVLSCSADDAVSGLVTAKTCNDSPCCCDRSCSTNDDTALLECCLGICKAATTTPASTTPPPSTDVRQPNSYLVHSSGAAGVPVVPVIAGAAGVALLVFALVFWCSYRACLSEVSMAPLCSRILLHLLQGRLPIPASLALERLC